MAMGYEVHRKIREGRARSGERDHSVRAFFGVRFRKDVARPDVEDDSGKCSQIQEQAVFRKGEKQRRKRSGNRCHGVCEKEFFRPVRRILVGEHEGDRVHAVGEPVCDDRESDREPYGGIDLKTEPDSYSVNEAVSNEGERGCGSHVRMVVVGVVGFMVVMDEHGLFEEMEG